MAKIPTVAKRVTAPVRRPGVHSKNNHSSHKSSKNYQKPYRKQGR